MDKEVSLLTDVNLVFVNPEERVCSLYHKHFREIDGASVVKGSISEGEDTLVLPMASAFGLCSSIGFVRSVLDQLGSEVKEKITNHIVRKYLGEQPVGSAFIIKNSGNNLKYRFIIVVSLFRAVTCRGDEMAWLDPCNIPIDYAYGAMRGLLLRVFQHNATTRNNKIKTIYCPDFFKLAQEAPTVEPHPPEAPEHVVRLMALACRGFMAVGPRPQQWLQALFIESRIMKDKGEDIEELLTSGRLEVRGLYNEEELEAVIGWSRNNKDVERQKMAIRVLAACLHRRDKQFKVSTWDVTHTITSHKGGCFPLMLDMVMQGTISVHTELDKKELFLGEVIGKGSAGVVYRGTWQTDTHVAIKEFSDEISAANKMSFIRELSIMCLVRHTNLVRCHGGITTDSKIYIVQELMQCNLRDVLAQTSIYMDPGIATCIAIGVASGIEFLHEHCNLIHRDLKSMNVLLSTINNDLQVKITDFGSSRLIDKKSIMTGNVGTVAWIAPEVFQGKKYNDRADVYSFAIIMWELVTRKIPFSHLSSFAIPVSVIKGERPPIPKDINPNWKRLMTQSWNKSSKRRPPMSKVVKDLRAHHKSLLPTQKSQSTLDLMSLLSGSSSSLTNAVSAQSSFPPQSLSGESSQSQRSSSQSLDASESATITCDIPPLWSEPIAAIEVEVNGDFSNLKQNLDMGTINIHKQRLLLFRADNLTVNFVEFAQRIFKFEAKKEAEILDSLPAVSKDKGNAAQLFAQNLLYQIGCGVGQKSCRDFLRNRDIPSAVVRSNVAFVQSAFMGLAFVELLSESILNGEPDDVIITRNRSSFEYEAWQGQTKHNSRCNCSFHAGFIAGWSTTATGFFRVTAEIMCKSKGDSDCLFVTTNPANLDNAVKVFAERYSISDKVSIPSFLSFRLLHETSEMIMDPPSGAASSEEVSTGEPGQEDSSFTSSTPLTSTSTPHSTASSPFSQRTADHSSSLESGLSAEFFLKSNWFETVMSVAVPLSVSCNDAGIEKKIAPECFQGETLTKDKIDAMTAEELDKFLIDPTLATVELADDKCVLIPCDMFSRGLLNMVQRLNTTERIQSKAFSYRFLYEFGYSTGHNNCKWFCGRVLNHADAITRFKALTTNLLYFGWSSLKIVSGLDINALQSDDLKFRIVCQANHSFEASTFKSSKPKTNPTTTSDIKQDPECVCAMHCGFISGWFHACFGVKVLTAETRCIAIGDRRCEFLIARRNHMKGFLPTNSPRSAASLYLDSPNDNLMRAKTAPSLKKFRDMPKSPVIDEVSTTESESTK
eukprot:TRINITY_DN2552_c0_g2_i1.p1 TRINITY_DN2552_c0_g2~~TRINITY_DN2552_c0_g2_i1.p1  ORF type:complete len:1280 (+),score=216.70 TRINITY_DN2552_c0_g2_i1:44-3883(+)